MTFVSPTKPPAEHRLPIVKTGGTMLRLGFKAIRPALHKPAIHYDVATQQSDPAMIDAHCDHAAGLAGVNGSIYCVEDPDADGDGSPAVKTAMTTIQPLIQRNRDFGMTASIRIMTIG